MWAMASLNLPSGKFRAVMFDSFVGNCQLMCLLLLEDELDCLSVARLLLDDIISPAYKWSDGSWHL